MKSTIFRPPRAITKVEIMGEIKNRAALPAAKTACLCISSYSMSDTLALAAGSIMDENKADTKTPHPIK